MSQIDTNELNPLSFSQRLEEINDIQDFISECYDEKDTESLKELHKVYKTLYKQQIESKPEKSMVVFEGMMFISWVEFLIYSLSLEDVTIDRIYKPTRNFQFEILIYALFNQFQLSILFNSFERIVLTDIKG